MSKPSQATEPGKLSTALRVSADQQPLYDELCALIASSRQRLAGAVNAELTRLYWSVGERLRTEVLGGADRAKYGDQLINRVGDQLAQEFGRGFEAKNLRRMVQFAQTFPLPEIVATLSRQLSWSHFVNLLPLKTEPARQFYASQAATNTWSVRELRHQIERKAFERTELASLQAPTPVRAEPVETSGFDTNPALVFKDPYFLDFLGLRQGHDEADLEAAILRQLEGFILELGRGFAFVERQKRMVIDGDDFYLDLLFYYRRLRRLVAIELKLGRFKATHKGQMELYLTLKKQLTARKHLIDRMSTLFLVPFKVHLLGESAMRPIAPHPPRLAALLLLAGNSLRRRPALPCTPLAAHSGASNCFFKV